MKTGFFFEKITRVDLVLDFASSNNLDLIGVWVKDKEGLPSNTLFQDFEDKLIEQIELAIIFLDGASYFNIATKALKKGIHIFLASLPDYNLEELIVLKDLAFEIDRKVGFGCSGFELVDSKELYSKHFMIQLNRDAGIETNDKSFKRILVNDIASFVRLKPCGVKKIRVNGIPLFNKNPKAFNLRLEYDNNSVIAHSLTRIDEPIRYSFRLFYGEDSYFNDILVNDISFNSDILFTPELLLSDSLYSSNLKQFIVELVNRIPLRFGIDKAIETMTHLGTIEDKLSPMN